MTSFPQTPVVAKPIPTFINLEAGKKYYWCSCGLSKKQPFCDGSHKGTPMKPLAFEVDKTKKYLMCRCKTTKKGPFCDLSHVSVLRKMYLSKALLAVGAGVTTAYLANSFLFAPKRNEKLE